MNDSGSKPELFREGFRTSRAPEDQGTREQGIREGDFTSLVTNPPTSDRVSTSPESTREDEPDRSLYSAAWIVAGRCIRDAVAKIEWEDYPEIGEYDWQLIRDTIRDMVGDGKHDGIINPDPLAYEAAYAYLESRAKSVDESVPTDHSDGTAAPSTAASVDESSSRVVSSASPSTGDQQ